MMVLARSCVEEATPRLGVGAAELLGGLDPLLHHAMHGLKSGLGRLSVGDAASELGHLGDEGDVVLGPEDDDFVLRCGAPSRYLMMMPLTCLT